jgi:hypothetical protein
MILGCPRPKYFFSYLSNLLPQKIRLPLISFFSGVSYIWGSYIPLLGPPPAPCFTGLSLPPPPKRPSQTDTTVALIYYN